MLHTNRYKGARLAQAALQRMPWLQSSKVKAKRHSSIRLPQFARTFMKYTSLLESLTGIVSRSNPYEFIKLKLQVKQAR